MPYESWPYFGVFSVLIAASLGFPIPEDIPLLTGGYLCHRGFAELTKMIMVGMIGVLSGDMLLYTMGRKWGHHIVEHRFVRRLIRPARLLMAERLFNEQGVKIIFAARFLPGLRPMLFVASGVLRVPALTFVLVDGFAACISVPLLIILGSVFSHNLDQLISGVRTVTHTITIGIVAIALIATGIYLHYRQKRMMASTGIDKTIDAQALAHMPTEGKISTLESEEADRKKLKGSVALQTAKGIPTPD